MRKKTEWATFLDNQSLAGVGSRVGIEAYICSNELSLKNLLSQNLLVIWKIFRPLWDQSICQVNVVIML